MVSSATGRNPFYSVVPDIVTRALVKLYISFENTGLSRLEEYFLSLSGHHHIHERLSWSMPGMSKMFRVEDPMSRIANGFNICIPWGCCEAPFVLRRIPVPCAHYSDTEII